MNAEQPSSQPRRLGGKPANGRYSSGRLKSDELGNRPQARCTTEGAILEIGLTLRMVVMAAVGGGAASGRTELHQERSATRWHEPDGDIGAKK